MVTMGRANPTYRDARQVVGERWDDFRRPLQNRDQPRFNQFFVYTREHADASGLLNHENPLLPMSVSINLEQEAWLDDHEQRLADLETTHTTGEQPDTGSDSE